jgi:asparagine synthase (glutamine-hydrolysing)
MAGITVRFPLLSDELVDFSLSLPPELKLKKLRLRYFFKEALRDFLPPEIIAKKKHGFGLPFGVWLARDASLNAIASEALERLADRGITNKSVARVLMKDRLHEHPGYYGELVWILTVMSQWLDSHSGARRERETVTVS